MIYITLFFSALISATLFPLGSEALLIYDIKQGYNLYLLLLFATTGNVLGSVINYYLGLKGEEYLVEKNYLKEEKIKKYKSFFDRFGGFALLLSWMPIVGDPITFIAGILKYDIKKFLFLVTLAKFGRYLILALLII
ncbi:YqaA family protein [Arcobacter sp. LA11]|uniref:YqaA family protein n=1 Tax=Arcobacter sp. LA11 TaxID=1898176 RepID=UPI000935411B|nr:YqaA family protein [Arcobacter sp. LA11]